MSRRHRDRGHTRPHHRADASRPSASSRLSVRPAPETSPEAAHATPEDVRELEAPLETPNDASNGEAPFNAPDEALRTAQLATPGDSIELAAPAEPPEPASAVVDVPASPAPEAVPAPRQAAAEFVPHLVEHAPQRPEPPVLPPATHANGSPASVNGAPLAARQASFTPPPIGVAPSGEHASIGDPGIRPPGSCTPAQLRRFIKSRPWIPMHELRRRFAINGPDDEVTRVDVEDGCLFVGLPAREGQILGDLVRAGEVGYELSRDPTTPVIVGVYPMRPVPRL